jgi:hypothetical protein
MIRAVSPRMTKTTVSKRPSPILKLRMIVIRTCDREPVLESLGRLLEGNAMLLQIGGCFPSIPEKLVITQESEDTSELPNCRGEQLFWRADRSCRCR